MAIITQAAELARTPAPEAPRQVDSIEAQAPSVETKEEATKAPDEQLSPKFAALARKERALRQQARQLQAEREAMKAKESEYQSSYIQKSRLTEDPLSVLTEAGVTYDQITQAILNGNPEQAAIQKMQQKLQAIEEQQNKARTMEQERQAQQYEQAVTQIRNEAKILIDADPEFETIKETGSVEAVVELIKETFNTTGNILSVEEASREVEEYLMGEAIKMAGLKKVRSKLNPEQPQAQPQKPQETQKPQNTLKTLTNAVNAQSSKPLSARDRRERAIAAFYGKLDQ